MQWVSGLLLNTTNKRRDVFAFLVEANYERKKETDFKNSRKKCGSKK